MRKIIISFLLVFVFLVGTTKINAVEQQSDYESLLVKEVALGGAHTLLLTETGTVYAWGNNQRGQVGDQSTINRTSPVNITSRFNLFENEVVVKVRAGVDNSAAITNLNNVYIWGANAGGQLGQGNFNEYYNKPTKLTNISLNEGEYIVDVQIPKYSGSRMNHIVLLTSEHRVFGAGSSGYGQLGISDAVNRVDKNTFIDITSSFPLLEDEYILEVQAGYPGSTAVLTNLNRLYYTGFNEELNINNNKGNIYVPVEISEAIGLTVDEKVRSFSLGNFSQSIITDKGRIIVFGDNRDGKLGLDSGVSNVPVSDITKRIYEYVSYVDKFVFSVETFYFVDNNNQFYFGGMDLSGEFGNNIEAQPNQPIIHINPDVPIAKNDKVVMISTGYAFSIAVSKLGRVFTTGLNTNGQLGLGNTTSVKVWTELTFGDLAQAKTNAKAYINNLFNTYNEESYDEESYQELVDAKNTALNNIDLATNNSGINTAKKNGQVAIEAVNGLITTNLNQYINDLSNAYKSLIKSDYYADDMKEVTDLYFKNIDLIKKSISLEEAKNLFDETMTKIEQLVKAPTYKVTFKSKGTELSSITDKPGTIITAPQNVSVPKGYTFGGWDKEITPIQNQDVVYNVVFIPIDYQIQWMGIEGLDITLPPTYNLDNVPKLPVLTKEGYVFRGWYSAPIRGLKYNSFPNYTGDQTLYAVFDKAYKVTFNTNDGSLIEPLVVGETQKITMPSNPIRTGYNFIGWDKEVPASMPGNDLVFNAVWEIGEYTITFDTNGGTVIEDLKLKYNDLINIKNPTKEGYVFNGWNIEVPISMPGNDLTLVANWIKYNSNSSVATIEGIDEAIDEDRFDNKNIEVSVTVDTKENTSVIQDEKDKITLFINNNLEFKTFKVYYLDILVTVLEVETGQKTNITETDNKLIFKIHIPLEHQKGKNYKVVRIHNGVVEELITTYDKDTNEVRFESDKFSTYALVYETGSSFNIYWILLGVLSFGIILFVIFFIIFKKRKNKEEDDNLDENDDNAVFLGLNTRHKMSFKAKISLSSHNIREKYSVIKSEIFKFEPAKTQISFKHETLLVKNKIVLKIRVRGRALHLYARLPISTINKFNAINVIDIKEYSDTPVLVIIREKDSLDNALKLINEIKKEYNLTIEDRSIDALKEHPVLSKKKLIELGLIRKKELVGKYYLD